VDFPPRFPFDFDDHAKDVSLANANINIVHSFVVALAFGFGIIAFIIVGSVRFWLFQLHLRCFASSSSSAENTP